MTLANTAAYRHAPQLSVSGFIETIDGTEGSNHWLHPYRCVGQPASGNATRCEAFRHRGQMPNKDRPQVERHVPKSGVGWLLNDQQGKVCNFTNANPNSHAQWVIVETRPLRGSGQPVVRRMLRHNAIEAWETMQKSGG